jgi:hypothetical protein
MSQITVVCENPNCRKLFGKPLAEFNRSKKLERPHYCSQSCWGKHKGSLNFKNKANRDTSYLRNIIRTDDLSRFRYHLRVMKKSAKHRKNECNVTLEQLNNLWNKQKGICPYTGWELIILPSTTQYETTDLTINRASVDRIDSSLGYLLDNIHFVAVIANFAKNSFTEQELLDFCFSVYQYRVLGINNNQSVGEKSQPKLSAKPRRDEYSPFRRHLISARRRANSANRECTITLEYLKNIWENQGDRCIYTGWLLDNPECTNYDNPLHPKRASLDRIDSGLGYIPGNVQFICAMANYAKRDFPEAAFLEFCQAVVEFHDTKTNQFVVALSSP